MAKVALVFGATGIVGSMIAEDLAKNTSPNEWKKIIITSRREPVLDVKDDRIHFVSIDLENDESEIKQKLLEAGGQETTHVFFTAYIHSKGWDPYVLTSKNTPIFQKAIRAVDSIAPNLQRVVLQTGLKYYGLHRQALKHTPVEETYGRVIFPEPDFYYEQEDFLVSFQQGKKWKYTTDRPSHILGVTRGNGMSIVPSLAIYFLVQKELGKKALFPGNEAAYKGVCDTSNADLIAQFSIWLSTLPEAENEHFNIIDHNTIRDTWEQEWKVYADFFGVEVEHPDFAKFPAFSFQEYMADKKEVWDSVVKKHGGDPELWNYATWDFADGVCGMPWPVGPVSISKAVKLGWNKQIPSTESHLQVLNKLKHLKMIPQ